LGQLGAVLRGLCCSWQARADTTKASLRGKRKSAGWDDSFIAALIAG
jgi:hypothetical protein